MGAPENPEEFVRFEADDLTVYVAQELLEKLEPETRQMPFYIDGYGRFWLVIAKPWTDVDL